MTCVYDFQAETVDGTVETLEIYKDKVLLIVNTASQCGFAPQLEGFEILYKKYKETGLVIIGFPCNQFGHQEPESNATDIQHFCRMRYGITFPMYTKLKVNGANTHPLFQYLKKTAPGIFGSTPIKWNFTKFLTNKKGEVIKRFSPTTKPKKLETQIASALAQ